MSKVKGTITQSYAHHTMGTITYTQVTGSLSEDGYGYQAKPTADSTTITVDNTNITIDSD